ncbi:MAG: transcription antitermination factor NusB [Lachnospiraceae bacterium]|nr:transcription antitermination factor NusB [Lachnospiraceae bacterium]
MNRKSEREFTFKLLFMSDFYDKKELKDELLLYFDAPFPFEENSEKNEDINELSSLKENLSDDDRRRIVARYVEIIDKFDEIDKKISEVSKGWTIDRIGKVELAILRLAVYEILYDEGIPTSVSINEAVELAKKFGPQDSYSFVNGILARFA